LRRFLAHIEMGIHLEAALDFPLDLNPTVDQNWLHFSQIYQSIPDANELVTLVRVLSMRSWKIKFTD
jgi:hypothetical protein